MGRNKIYNNISNMKFTCIIALVGAASAIHMTADPYPLQSGTAVAIKKTQATTNVGDFDVAYKESGVPTVKDATNGFQDGQQFQIFSNMDGGRVVYATRQPIETKTTHPAGKYEVLTHSTQFEVKIREATGQAQEYFYFHPRTGTIRSVENGSMCLQWDHTKS